jgi:hypothetical protein
MREVHNAEKSLTLANTIGMVTFGSFSGRPPTKDTE